MFGIAVRLDTHHRNHSALNEWLLSERSLFEANFYPLVSVKMEDNHILAHHPVFRLTSVNNHRTFVVNG